MGHMHRGELQTIRIECDSKTC